MKMRFLLISVFVGSMFIVSVLIAVLTISKLRHREEIRAKAVEIRDVRSIYASLRLFQDTEAYQQMLDDSIDDWLVFSENSEQSLYELLSNPDNAPYGGYLMHIKEDAIVYGTFLNPWGNPYRAAIFTGRGGSENHFREMGLCPGKNGSAILVLSNHQSGDHTLCQSKEDISDFLNN